MKSRIVRLNILLVCVDGGVVTRGVWQGEVMGCDGAVQGYVTGCYWGEYNGCDRVCVQGGLHSPDQRHTPVQKHTPGTSGSH